MPKTQKSKTSKLPTAINKVTPIPKANAKLITNLVKQSGKITGYKLSSGEIVTKAKAVSMAKAGGITGVGVATRNGSEYLRTLADSNNQVNNLSDLPSISQ